MDSTSITDFQLDRVMREYEHQQHQIPEHLEHLVLCTPDEVAKKRILARIRLIGTNRGNHVRSEIEDVFWGIDLWPLYALKILIGEDDFSYRARVSFATFLHGNGFVDLPLALRMLQFYNTKWINNAYFERRWSKFVAIFSTLNKINDDRFPDYNHLSYRYWFFSINNGYTMFYSGQKRAKYEN